MDYKFFWLISSVLVTLYPSTALKDNGRISNGYIPTENFNVTVRIVSAVDEQTSRGYLCTGVAVTPQHVVTVAQGIAGFAVWRIGYGSIHVDQQYQVISKSAVIHPQFNANLLHNNIGIIRIPYVRSNWHYYEIDFTTPLAPFSFALGYGFINDQSELASVLQGIFLNTSPKATCLEYFNDVIVQDNNLCVITNNELHNIRNGDQGGPVIDTISMGLFGIISFWGSTDRSPIVIVDLRAYRDFLEGQFNV